MNREKRILFSLFLTGFTSIVSQTILVRELLIVFFGNELTIGIILANWVLLMGTGSYLFGYIADRMGKRISVFVLLLVIVSLYLPVSIFLLRNIKNILGIVPGLFETFYISFVLLFPISFSLGGMFSLGCRFYDDSIKNPASSVSRGYVLDSLGSLLGGILFAYLLIRTNSFNTCLVLSILLVLSGILISEKKGILSLLFAILFVVLLTGMGNKLQEFSIRQQWKGYEVIHYENSLYNNITTLKKENQYTILTNGNPIITSPIPDIASVEENVHLPFLFHHNPQNVLVIGGEITGIVNEIRKYPSCNVTYVELDPAIINAVRRISKNLKDMKLNLISADARKFIDETDSRYDVVLINFSSPISLELNRYFTFEFFEKVKSTLNPDGIMYVTLPGSLTYLNLELKNLNASIYETLKKTFDFTRVIPGESNNIYLCSSAKNLNKIKTETLVGRAKKYNLNLSFLTPDYIKYKLDQKWVDWFLKSLSDVKEVKLNYDFKPIGAFFAISYWSAMFSGKTAGLLNFLQKINLRWIMTAVLIIGMVLIIFALIGKNLNSIKVSYLMFTTGFSGMCFTILLFLSFQIFYGYLYYKLGLLLALFMFGLSVGALCSEMLLRRREFALKDEPHSAREDALSAANVSLRGLLRLSASPPVIFSEIGIIVFSFLLPETISRFGSFEVTFFILSFLSGILVGTEFPYAVQFFPHIAAGEKAGLIYGMDLLGAFFSATVVSVWLLPVYGLAICCYFIVLLKVISIGLLSIQRIK